MDSASASIYRGHVMHHRLRPVSHRFTYRVFSLLLDLARLDDVARRSNLLRIDGPGLVSFHQRDHGPRTGAPLLPWVHAQLVAAGIDLLPARVTMLTMPRILGFVFNPLSVYLCYAADERLAAIVYEVKNTFGDQHAYALAVDDDGPPGRVLDQSCAKRFFVSPFIAMGGRYRFRLKEPGDRLALVIREDDEAGCFFVASHTGTRLELTDRHLLTCLLGDLVMTFRVVAGIHLEAFWLWLKGAPYFSRDAGERPSS